MALDAATLGTLVQFSIPKLSIGDPQAVQAAKTLTKLMDLAVGQEEKQAFSSAIQPLVALLVLPPPLPTALLEHAAGALMRLAEGGDELRDEIANAGAITPLVALLNDAGQPAVQKNAAGALKHLAGGSEARKADIATAVGAIDGFVALLGDANASPVAKEHAAAALAHLADGGADIAAVEGRRADIAAAAGAIERLAALLRDGDAFPGAKEQAAAALAHLAVGNKARSRDVASKGAIQPLVALLGATATAGAQEQAAAALTHLATDSKVRRDDIAASGAVESLMALLNGATPLRVLQRALGLLRELVKQKNTK